MANTENMNKKDMSRILLATVSLGLVWLYFALVILLGQSIGGMYIGLELIAASLPLVMGTFFFLIRYFIFCGLVGSKQILNITLSLFFSLGSLLIVDIIYSLYLNFHAFGKSRLKDSRVLDPAFIFGEVSPRKFYPTDQNFLLYKTNYRVSGVAYGNLYDPELMGLPTLESVFKLNQFSYAIDQFGFRNTIPLGQADIFALGDSFTFGWRIVAEKTWVKLLGHAINRPIYNLGIDSIGPKQELELLKYMLRTKGKSMRIRKILWMIYEGNDLEDSYENIRPMAPSPSKARQVIEGTLLQSLSNALWRIKKQAMITKLRNGEITLQFPSLQASDYNPYVIEGIKSWYPFYQSTILGPRLFLPNYIKKAKKPISYVLNHPNRPILDQVFEEMAQLGKEFSFKIVVIIVPTAARLHGPFYENFPSISNDAPFIDYVSKLSGRMGFQTLNLLPSLRPYGEKELLYFRDDTHWNERGNELAAEIILREVFQK